jgi:hypothetical protein
VLPISGAPDSAWDEIHHAREGMGLEKRINEMILCRSGDSPSFSGVFLRRRTSSSYTSVDSSWNCCLVRLVNFERAWARDSCGAEGT